MTRISGFIRRRTAGDCSRLFCNWRRTRRGRARTAGDRIPGDGLSAVPSAAVEQEPDRNQQQRSRSAQCPKPAEASFFVLGLVLALDRALDGQLDHAVSRILVDDLGLDWRVLCGRRVTTRGRSCGSALILVARLIFRSVPFVSPVAQDDDAVVGLHARLCGIPNRCRRPSGSDGRTKRRSRRARNQTRRRFFHVLFLVFLFSRSLGLLLLLLFGGSLGFFGLFCWRFGRRTRVLCLRQIGKGQRHERDDREPPPSNKPSRVLACVGFGGT